MMEGLVGDVFSGGQALLGEDSSVMARMQKKFWKTKQVLIKATGKKEDEYVVASDADLDAKLEFFRSVQSTCTELLKVIQRYQHRMTTLSQEENELGLFLRFQAEHDRTKAGNMMDATSRALCASAKQRLAMCSPLHRLQQEVETFRRRAIADTLLTMGRMEKARTEYRGALLWMKAASQELDPDTYKQLERFRKVQSQVRGTKSQFDKLKNDVCQKVDMLGASRCNMLSHSLCTYQTTLLQFWEQTARTMSGIHRDFQGHVPYQFTTLKDLRDPLEQLTEEDGEEEEKKTKTTPRDDDDLVSLDDVMPLDGPSDFGLGGDLLPGGPSLPRPSASQRDQEDEEVRQQGDIAFLKDLLSPGPGGGADEFSSEWQDAFGLFDAPNPNPASNSPAAISGLATGGAPSPPLHTQNSTGFLPSQLLDHSLGSAGWLTPPMFQAPPLQPPPLSSPDQSALPAPSSTASAARGGSRDMSAWFNLFADLDPLSNPDAIGRSEDELLNA